IPLPFVSMQIILYDLTNLLRFSNFLIQQFPFFLKIRGLRGFAPFLMACVSKASFFIFSFLFFFIFFIEILFKENTINRYMFNLSMFGYMFRYMFRQFLDIGRVRKRSL